MTTDDRLIQLVTENGRRALGLAYALTGRSADADDLVQKAVLVAARKPEQIPLTGAWPWFARILTLEARNWRRSQTRKSVSELQMSTEDPQSVDPARALHNREMAAQMRQELAGLSSSEREAIALIHITGLSYREAATVLGLAPSTLNQRVATALKRLRQRLGLGHEPLCAALLLVAEDIPSELIEQSAKRWLQVAAATSTTAAASLIGGMIVAKKISVAVAVLSLLLAVGFWLQSEQPSELELTGAKTAEVLVPEPSIGRHEKLLPLASASEFRAEVSSEPMIHFGRVSGLVTHSEGEVETVAEVRLIAAIGARQLVDQTITTTAEGRFEFVVELPASLRQERVTIGLIAEAEGMVGSQRHGLWLEEGLELEGLDLYVYRPAQLTGRLVSSVDGRAVANARLRLTYYSSLRGPAEIAAGAGRRQLPGPQGNSNLLATTTQENGAFSFQNLAPGSVSISLEGIGTTLEVASPLLGSLHDLVLREAEIKEGLLLSAALGILRFETDVAPTEHLSIHYQVGPFWSSQVLEPKGRGPYGIIGIRPDLKAIKLQTTSQASEVIVVDPQEPGEIDLGTIVLQDRSFWSGLVVDLDGQGVAGARVILTSLDDRRSMMAMTDAEGRFRVQPGTERRLRLRVQHRDFAELIDEVEWLTEADEPIVRLPASVSVSGHVRIAGRTPTALERGADGSENPLTVSLFAADTKLPITPIQVVYSQHGQVPNREGGFEFPAVGPGDYRVVAACNGRVALSEVFSIKDASRADIVVEISAGADLVGRLLANGKGLKGERVFLSQKAQSLRKNSSDLQTLTDADGRFQFIAVAAGTWFLKGEDEGLLAGALLSERRVVLKDGETLERDLVFDRGGEQVSGRVLVAGRPRFKSALVFKPGVVLPIARASVSKTGDFAIKKLAAGNYYLWLVDDLYNPSVLKREVLEIRGAELLRFEKNYPGATLQGSINGAETAQIALRLLIEDEIGSDAASKHAVIETQAQDGAFFLDGLVGGLYEVLVSAPGTAPRRLTMELSPGTKVTIDLLDAGATLALKVAQLEGFRESDAGGGFFDQLMIVRILDAQGQEVGVLDESRYLRLTEGLSRSLTLAPGNYEVLVQGKLIETLRYSVELAAGQTQTLTVRPRRAAELRLKLLSDSLDSQALQGLQLSVFRPDESRVEEVDMALAAGASDQVSLAERVLRILPLTAGEFRIVVEIPGFKTATVAVRLNAAEIKTADLRLELEP